MSLFSSTAPGLDLQSSILNLEFLSRRVRGCRTYILLSLDWAPPAIFWVRRDTSSCLRSSSCFWRSSLFLPQSCWLLTLPDDCQIHPSAFPPISRIARAVGFTIVNDCRCVGGRESFVESRCCLVIVALPKVREARARRVCEFTAKNDRGAGKREAPPFPRLGPNATPGCRPHHQRRGSILSSTWGRCWSLLLIEC